MGDATGSIALTVGDEMMLYYSFLLCNKTKNSEPLVNIEILADSHDEQPIKNCLQQFITDEKKKCGHKSKAIPIIFTCDMSSPILKATVHSFNNESIEEYIGRSYKIVTGKASTKELPVKPSKLFVHFCSSHIPHACFFKISEKILYWKQNENYNVLLQRSSKFREMGNFL